MNKKHWHRTGLIIFGLWVLMTAYFAYLHTFRFKTFYPDEEIILDNQQFIIQEVEAINFERDFPDFYDIWYMNALNRVPVILRQPFYYVVNFYSQPGITYKDTWNAIIKGIAVPGLEQNFERYDIYIDGHASGNGFQQSADKNYSLFNTRGDYYYGKEIDQPVILIIKDKVTGRKAEVKLIPQWQKKYYFMRLPSNQAADPGVTARRFLYLASQGQKQEALKLVAPDRRNEFTWPPVGDIWSQINPEDDLRYSLERRESQSGEVIYTFNIQGIDTFALDMIKNKDHYEIIEIK